MGFKVRARDKKEIDGCTNQENELSNRMRTRKYSFEDEKARIQPHHLDFYR